MVASLPDLTATLIANGDTDDCQARSLHLLDRRIAVVSNVPEFLTLLDAACAEFMDDGSRDATETMYVVRRRREGDICLADPGHRSTVCERPVDAFYFWTGQVGGNRLFRGRHLLIHGSALCHDGQTHIFAGPSLAGKTTLTLRLAAAGFLVLSDEFVPLDPDTGNVEPFRRALFVRRATLNALDRDAPDTRGCVSMVEPGSADPKDPSNERVMLPADRLSPRPRAIPPIASLNFLSGFRTDATATRRLSPAEGMARTMDCLVNASHLTLEQRRIALTGLGRLLATVPCREILSGPLVEPLDPLVASLTAPVRMPDHAERTALARIVETSLRGLGKEPPNA